MPSAIRVQPRGHIHPDSARSRDRERGRGVLDRAQGLLERSAGAAAGTARSCGTSQRTPRKSASPSRQQTASVSSIPPDPQRAWAQPSSSVIYQIGVFDSDANTLYFVAAAPSPIASSTTAEKPA